MRPESLAVQGMRYMPEQGRHAPCSYILCTCALVVRTIRWFYADGGSNGGADAGADGGGVAAACRSLSMPD